MRIKLKCGQCGEVIFCDDRVLDTPMQCGDCGFPISIETYPKLRQLKVTRDAERKQQATDRERERKRVEQPPPPSIEDHLDAARPGPAESKADVEIRIQVIGPVKWYRSMWSRYRTATAFVHGVVLAMIVVGWLNYEPHTQQSHVHTVRQLQPSNTTPPSPDTHSGAEMTPEERAYVKDLVLLRMSLPQNDHTSRMWMLLADLGDAGYRVDGAPLNSEHAIRMALSGSIGTQPPVIGTYRVDWCLDVHGRIHGKPTSWLRFQDDNSVDPSNVVTAAEREWNRWMSRHLPGDVSLASEMLIDSAETMRQVANRGGDVTAWDEPGTFKVNYRGWQYDDKQYHVELEQRAGDYTFKVSIRDNKAMDGVPPWCRIMIDFIYED